MTSKYDRYSKEELVKIIEERDRKPRLGLVWERDERRWMTLRFFLQERAGCYLSN